MRTWGIVIIFTCFSIIGLITILATGCGNGSSSDDDFINDDTSFLYGSVAITGDGPFAGTSFIPEDAWIDNRMKGSETVFYGFWNENTHLPSEDRNHLYIDKSVMSPGINISFRLFLSTSSTTYTYRYGSLRSPDDCGSISQDTSMSTITLSNVRLERPPGEAILLNGLLKY